MTDTKMSVQKSLLTRCLATIHTVEAGPVALHSLSLSNSALHSSLNSSQSRVLLMPSSSGAQIMSTAKYQQSSRPPFCLPNDAFE